MLSRARTLDVAKQSRPKRPSGEAKVSSEAPKKQRRNSSNAERAPRKLVKGIVRTLKALIFCACRSFSLISPHLGCYTIENSATPFAYRHEPSFMCSLGACGRSTLIHRSNPLTLAEH